MISYETRRKFGLKLDSRALSTASSAPILPWTIDTLS